VDEQQAIKILEELRRRRGKPNILADCFPEQLAFIQDQSRLKAALCDRRAEKSYAACLWLVDGALKRPGTKQLYLALTRQSAKDIAWQDILKVIDQKNQLGCRFNESELRVHFPNGSTIKLMGADSDAKQQNKILGQKFFRIVIDEAASFSIDLDRFVNKTLMRCLTDLKGELALIGTPGNVKGFFYDITEQTGKAPGYSVHKWRSINNPYVAEHIKEEIANLIAQNPKVVEVPWFKQEYLGEWVSDDRLLCYYGLNEDNIIHSASELPNNLDDLIYILGIDLGYSPDPSALTMVGYDPHGDGRLYVLYSEKRYEQTVSDVAEWVRDYTFQGHKPHLMIVDEQKQIVEEMRQRHHLPLEAAVKHGKAENISMLNADLILGKIRIYEPNCPSLLEEMRSLVWDERLLPLRKEKAGLPNHCSDSFLYSWRRSTNYNAHKLVPNKTGHPIRTEEQLEEFWDRKAQEQEESW
jgi:phage terminase large subunit